MTGVNRVRCAIYTRKSTEEGLDQVFNTLDAQREACEAYIKSQAGEGWRALPEHYDDGGFSGGNLDRPAIKRLLADVDAGKLDAIIVYKVDRLTRSLTDFSRIVERLDAKGVSFVSVTQAFNTTTSMGRLTLNVLLSFAQFEREVTGERIRDKIAASKAKGMWMGGNVPLGYDLHDRCLIVNTAEAGQVRHIFERYLKLGSGVALMKELRRNAMVSKCWESRSGKQRGGAPFSCGALYYLLQNRLYVGQIVHRGTRHQGEHEAIVSDQLFDAVQEALTRNRQKHGSHVTRAQRCALAGLVRDSDAHPMKTSFSYGRRGKLYRYYISGSLDSSRSDAPKRPRRVPAAPLERLVLQAISALLQRQVTLADALPLISAVEVRERSIQLAIQPAAVAEPHEPIARIVDRLGGSLMPNRLVADGNCLRLIIDRRPVFRGGTAIGGNLAVSADSSAPVMLRAAHKLLQTHSMSPMEAATHPDAHAPAWQRQRRTMALGLLAPQIQKAMLQGAFAGSMERLLQDAPLAWADQKFNASHDKSVKLS